MKFYCIGWVRGKCSGYLGSGVGEGYVVFHEGDEATTTPVKSVFSECCVSRKPRCMMSWSELGFLDDGYVYVVFMKELFQLL